MNLADRPTPRTDAAIVSAEYIRREMDYYQHKFILADYGRDLEREHAALREALNCCLLALLNTRARDQYNHTVDMCRAILAATEPK